MKPTRTLKADCVPDEACTWVQEDSVKFTEKLSDIPDLCTCTCPPNGDTLSHEAADTGNPHGNVGLERLRNEGCDLDLLNVKKQTPLHLACAKNPCYVFKAAVGSFPFLFILSYFAML